MILPLMSVFFREESERILPLLTVFFLSLFFVANACLTKRPKVRIDKTTIFLIIFLIWCFANTAILGRSVGVNPIAKWVCVLLVFLFSDQLKEHRRAILYGLLISGLFQGVVVMLQSLHLLHSFSAYFPVSGTFSNPNHAACLIGLSCAIGLYLGKWKWLSIVTFFALVLCGSRGNVLGVAIIVCVLLWHKLLNKSKNKAVIYVAGSFAMAALAVLLVVLYRLNVDSADGRILIWRVCLSGIGNHPISGAGFGSVAADYMYLQAEWIRNHPDSSLLLLADNNRYCFNEILHLLFEQGVIGLALMCIVLYRSLRRAEITVLAGVSFLLISSLTLYTADIFPVFLSFWLLLALGKPQEKALFEINRPFYIALGIACILFSIHYINRKEVLPFPNYEKTCNEGEEYLESGDYDEAENRFLLAMDMIPSRLYAPYRLFKMYVEYGEKEKARAIGEKILSMRVKVFGNTTIQVREEVRKWMTSAARGEKISVKENGTN